MSGPISTASRLAATLRRGLKKPPRYIAARLWHEVDARLERYRAPRRARRLIPRKLAASQGHADIDAWWAALARRPFLVPEKFDTAALEALCAGERGRILTAAERAKSHEVDLLGSGPVSLGDDIDWQRDYKSGRRWEPGYCRDLAYNDLDQPSDVKFPWEVSRMQWLIPLGQAYVLTGEEGYAEALRDLIDDWIADNPYAHSINWACTMDVALRILSWTWFFHVFRNAPSWSDPGFRGRFLAALYQHGDFTLRHLEKSDINGNHYTADAAGLVFAGLFFGGGKEPANWLRRGWEILSGEIELQVFEDGVDFEASIPYHRLVQELFLLPALYRRRHGMEVSATYRRRLLAMARFTAAYSRPDGSVPLWGDADDARALPFRAHPINDHRYLIGIAGLEFDDPELIAAFSGPRSEAAWLLGPARAADLPDRPRAAPAPSAAFPDGGFFVLRNESDHVFVDCGPLGLGGRGGHGHNDLLSFEAVLDGVHLVTDCGAYLYTADYRERNAFRSTAYHNTPRIDGEEINRFIRPDYLWLFHDDAGHEVADCSFSAARDRLILKHTGYRRLARPLTVVRTMTLDHREHMLAIEDSFEGEGHHGVEIPLHLAPGVEARIGTGEGELLADGKSFLMSWAPADAWEAAVSGARVSPTYGVALPAERIHWRRSGPLSPLCVTIRPRRQ